MKYNAKYNRWFTKEGLIFRYDTKQDKLILCNQYTNVYGYLIFTVNKHKFFSHRAIYETFVSNIPTGFEIDHINTVRDDNRVDNLRAVTHKENQNNPLTRKHNSSSLLKNTNRLKKISSEFGEKYKEHFGICSNENIKQYKIEHQWYKRHGKCRWE
jgi:hypothetical protein